MTMEPLDDQHHITWASTPRQYRPSYSRIPSNPTVTGSPFPAVVTQTTSKPPRRRLSAVSFPTLAPLHSSPTVAKSGLTASASTKRLSIFPGQHGQTLESKGSRNATPTRIPTPVYRRVVKVGDNGRAVSSPVILPRASAKEVR
jgi:hypothetical protein